MPPISDLSGYISAWLSRYPEPDATDDDNAASREQESRWLASFNGAPSLSQDDAVKLVEWKFASMPHRKVRALKGVNDEHWDRAEHRIAESIRVDGDLPALINMANTYDGVWGWGPAMSSVVLAVFHPDRFTIADTRALASVRAIGYPVPDGRNFEFEHWEPYLAACRDLAEKCDRSLREVDQALWAADGNPSLPG